MLEVLAFADGTVLIEEDEKTIDEIANKVIATGKSYVIF